MLLFALKEENMHIFTYKNYRSILRYMKKINNIYSFESLSNAESGIILRHDWC